MEYVYEIPNNLKPEVCACIIEKFKGEVTNNLVYAEPVCFGVNLPPSWGGVYRTRQNTVAGFPELIGKELEQYVMQQLRRGI